MDTLLNNTILRNYGGLNNNNLLSIIQEDNETEMDHSLLYKPSNYFTQEQLTTMSKNFTQHFSVLTLNCQSINAKFDTIVLLVDQLRQNNFEFSAICLQETWLENDSDLSIFQIENYVCISQGKHCCHHGGLIIYLHERFNFQKLPIEQISVIWEGLFITIKHPALNTKNIILGNIYKPPLNNNNNDNIQTFRNELEPVISQLNHANSNIILTGDYNIDLLKLKQKHLFSEYFDTLVSQNLHPRITLPTRFNNTSGTLIDNIFSNISNSTDDISGILVSNISDHLPCFSCFKINTGHSKPSNHVYCPVLNQKSIESLYNDILSSDIMNKIDQENNADPNKNYCILENIIVNSINLHLPLKKLKFNKHKHRRSKWVTNGIIKSITFRTSSTNPLILTLIST